VRSSTSWIRSLSALALAVVMAAAAAPSQAAPPAEPRGQAPAASAPGKPVTVMTRNIYLGADINRPVQAALAAQAQGGETTEILVALANATEVTRAIVDETDFPTRARLLADEIVRTSPDLIGLQEVALWRSGPLELQPGLVAVPNATDVDYDFLAILLDELRARGARYSAEVVGQRADVESPSFSGVPVPGLIGGRMRDVRLTMHDVILVRESGSLSVTGEHDEIFDRNLALGVAGLEFDFDRGYQWVDVRAGGKSFRFINTHLEAFSSDIALDQARQMVTEGTADGRSTVIACDCNSDPLDSSVKTGIGDTVPHKAPYELITETYTDQWLKWAPAEAGWTSGLNERVDEMPPTWTHRIDMIFGRTASGGPLGVDRGTVTGTEVTDRDPATGLWPSDHAGVVLRLRGL
jgi:endonuclease/exonuclease/phosphatase family metal-dependent hydrolase